jgi:AmpE protein
LLWLALRREGFVAAGLAGPVVHALEWLPVRLMVLAFALVGHYERTLEYLGKVAAQWDVSSERVVAEGANAAAGTEHDVLESGVLAETRGLLQRAVLVWAVAIALLVMIG